MCFLCRLRRIQLDKLKANCILDTPTRSELNVKPARKVMAPFWLFSWAVALSTAWLLPNHYLPWSGFHFDLWVACVLSLASAAVIIRSSATVQWHGATAMCGLLLLIPALQHAAGMMVFAGNTWISIAYLTGLLLALLTGAKWELQNPGQLADGLFLAIALASIASVGLQLHQWLQLDTLEMWIMPDNFGRPFANFGQPNQLGTFLLWGMLALGWGVLRHYVGRASAVLISAFLLFGLALTQSRTAWLAVALLVVAAFLWRNRWPSRWVPAVIVLMALYFYLCVFYVGKISQLLLIDRVEFLNADRISGDARPAIWRLFVDAAWQRPWEGYGWNQVVLGQFEVALDHPSLHSMFGHSHNLFLDLILWCGIPVGLLASCLLVLWLWRRIRAVRDAEEAVLVLFLLVVANHAMLELPLHYAYVLLPVGLIAGALNARQVATTVFTTGRWPFAAVWTVSVLLLGLIVRDYSRVEPGYQLLRYEWAQIKTDPGKPPDVLLLTQWREFIRLARFEPTPGMSQSDLEWMRDVTRIHPGAGPFQKMATALALNGRPEEARKWLQLLCKMTPESQCALVGRVWAKMAELDPRIAAVPWPK